jgi:uncharacterized protein YpuA (DUF1002 family)
VNAPISLSAVANAIGEEKANVAIAIAVIVSALAKQPQIDGKKLVSDIAEALKGDNRMHFVRDVVVNTCAVD